MKNLIFDWSGVVKDAVAGQLWITDRIFETYGVGPISLQEFREQWEQPYLLFYEKYLPKGFTAESQSKAYREAIYHKDCPKSFAFHGIVDVIQNLKSTGMFLAVVSSDLPEMLYSEVKEYGLEGVFSEIVTDVHDKSEAVQKIIKDNNLNLDDTFFIGDSNHEIDVAKKVGIKSIAVTWGFTSERKLKSKNPDYIVSTVKELEAAILQ